jgi:hypothetical protein
MTCAHLPLLQGPAQAASLATATSAARPAASLSCSMQYIPRSDCKQAGTTPHTIAHSTTPTAAPPPPPPGAVVVATSTMSVAAASCKGCTNVAPATQLAPVSAASSGQGRHSKVGPGRGGVKGGGGGGGEVGRRKIVSWQHQLVASVLAVDVNRPQSQYMYK